MGPATSKPKDRDRLPFPEEAPPSPADPMVGDNIDDLIERAAMVPTKPVGSSERSLLLALGCFALLDDPERLSAPPAPFTEMFKWHVLSMLRVCVVCRRSHCAFSRQALLVPPFGAPSAASAPGPDGDLPIGTAAQSLFSDTVRDPAMRFVCDECLDNMYIPLYEATAREVVCVAARTRGFGTGTTSIHVVDGPSECGGGGGGGGGGATATAAADEIDAPLKGVSRVSVAVTERPDAAAAAAKSKTSNGGLCLSVRALTLGGMQLDDCTIERILRNPSLKQLSIMVPLTNAHATNANAPNTMRGRISLCFSLPCSKYQ